MTTAYSLIQKLHKAPLNIDFNLMIGPILIREGFELYRNQ